MKTQDETRRRTLNLMPPAPANQATLFDVSQNDDLFPELDEPLPPAQPLQTIGKPHLFSEVVCLVCGLQSKVPVNAPAKLCGPCAIDLTITENGILARLEILDRRAAAIRDAWLAALDAAPADVLTRWEKAADAGVGPKEAFARSWATRRTDASDLAALLVAWETMDAECAEIERARAYEQRALEEVEVAQNE